MYEVELRLCAFNGMPLLLTKAAASLYTPVLIYISIYTPILSLWDEQPLPWKRWFGFHGDNVSACKGLGRIVMNKINK